tara:strand:+ start:352 stop:573 length:222 start_codon:yes stop_codon:yes gene_type:complete
LAVVEQLEDLVQLQEVVVTLQFFQVLQAQEEEVVDLVQHLVLLVVLVVDQVVEVEQGITLEIPLYKVMEILLR